MTTNNVVLEPRQSNVCRRWASVTTNLYRSSFLFYCLLALMFLAPGRAHAGIPPGPYTSSCTNASMKGTLLEATCKDYFGNPHKTDLQNAAECKDIRNINGDLRCVIAESHATGDHATDYDIIS